MVPFGAAAAGTGGDAALKILAGEPLPIQTRTEKAAGAAMILRAIIGTAFIVSSAAVSPPAAGAPDAPKAVPADLKVPVEAFAQRPFLSDPLLSPDGRRIATTVFVNGKENVAFYELPAAPDSKPKLIPVGNAQLRSYQWAGSDRLLIGVGGTTMVYGIPFPITRLLGYDLKSGKLTSLGRGGGFLGDDVIFIDPDGRYILLAAQKDPFTTPSVDRIELADGAATTVQKSKTGVWSWFADPGGFVRAGVDYGERRLKLYYRASAGDELRKIDTKKYPKDDAVIDMIRFVGDAQRGVVITNAQTGRFAAYEYDFASDTMGEPVFEHPSVDVGAIIPGEKGIDGVSYEDERPRIHWLNPEMARLQQSVDRILKGKTNLVSSRSRDGNVVLIWSGGADDPGTWFVYNRALKRMEAFARPYDKLDQTPLAAVKPVSYRARDGLTVPGYLTLPPGRKAEKLPLIVMPHGGPFSRDSWSYNSQVQFLASRGYAVLQPNFRGSTGYGLDYVTRGHGQVGTGMIDDIEDGAKWLIGEGIADGGRVCIMGGSYGGYAAIWSAMRNPGLYRCAISMAGVTDWKAMLKYDSKALMARRYAKKWRAQIEGSEGTDLDSISPAEQAALLKVPLLLAHGELDTNVPPSQAKNFVAAAKTARVPVESVFYPKAGHGFGTAEDAADFLKRVETFLATHNPS